MEEVRKNKTKALKRGMMLDAMASIRIRSDLISRNIFTILKTRTRRKALKAAVACRDVDKPATEPTTTTVSRKFQPLRRKGRNQCPKALRRSSIKNIMVKNHSRILKLRSWALPGAGPDKITAQ